MKENMGENGLSKDQTINYVRILYFIWIYFVEQKDEAFVSQLEGTFQKLASESRERPVFSFLAI